MPPGEDDYVLRRVWLSAEEEQGYYYGFANEGMWPLCHVAHVRPVFREPDWEAYRQVNQRFADAVVAEARSEDPIVLVQDYHFALLPAMIRARLPAATIITFWHIPWPNPESFGICPWRVELLEGLLGSTILGFHTRFHCKNFLETVDRYLEARIEHEHSTIAFRDSETLVESYPISIEWPSAETESSWPPVERCRADILASAGLPAGQRLAVGVDRFDYTKGILERLHAIERMLEKYPQWVGKFTFMQVAAPTRSSLEEYRLFRERIESVCTRINERFGRGGPLPVILRVQDHDQQALVRFYRAADACLVTSLHDGMNLVSKEFVATRNDEQGVLILSRFAGAARELTEALIVNPYHVEECADALHEALTMPAAEQRERMASLRLIVRQYNVYRWAGTNADRRRSAAPTPTHRGPRPAAQHAMIRVARFPCGAIGAVASCSSRRRKRLHPAQHEQQLGGAVEEEHRLRRRIVATDANRQPRRHRSAEDGLVVDVVPDEESGSRAAALDQRRQGVALVRHATGDDVDHALAAKAVERRREITEQRLDRRQRDGAVGGKPIVKGERILFVFDDDTGLGQRRRRDDEAMAQGIERLSRLVGQPARRVLGAVVADDEAGLEGEPRAHVGETAAGDHGDRMNAREFRQATRHFRRHAGIVGSVDDRRKRAVEVEGEQRLELHDCVERGLAARREEMFHPRQWRVRPRCWVQVRAVRDRSIDCSPSSHVDANHP